MTHPVATYQIEYLGVLHSLEWTAADREAGRIRAEICEQQAIGTLVLSPCHVCDGVRDPACSRCNGEGWVAREIEECPTCQGSGREELSYAPKRRDAVNPLYRLAVCASCDGVGAVVGYYERKKETK